MHTADLTGGCSVRMIHDFKVWKFAAMVEMSGSSCSFDIQFEELIH